MAGPLEQPATPVATFVIYDRASGEVLHTHHVAGAPGALLPERDEIVRAVLEHAALTTKREPDALACLEVDPNALRPRTAFRVDVAAQRLVELPRKE
jgi:hypothetical protein